MQRQKQGCALLSIRSATNLTIPQRLGIILMLFLLQLSFVPPVQQADAVSFTAMYQLFGNNWPNYSGTGGAPYSIEYLASQSTVEDLAEPTFSKSVYVSPTEPNKPVVTKYTNAYISAAKDIVDDMGQKGYDEMKNNYSSKAVVTADGEVQKKDGVTGSDYKAFKKAFQEFNGSSETSNFVASTLGDGENQLDGESSEALDTLLSPGYIIANFILAGTIKLIMWFFVIQTAVDIFFLLSPALRVALGRHKSDDDGFGATAAKMYRGIVSESALGALGLTKDEASGSLRMSASQFVEPDWGKYVMKRMKLFVGALTYLVLVRTGLLSTLVGLLAGGINAVLDAVANMF